MIDRADMNNEWVENAKPGGWNDADMLDYRVPPRYTYTHVQWQPWNLLKPLQQIT